MFTIQLTYAFSSIIHCNKDNGLLNCKSLYEIKRKCWFSIELIFPAQPISSILKVVFPTSLVGDRSVRTVRKVLTIVASDEVAITEYDDCRFVAIFTDVLIYINHESCCCCIVVLRPR